MVTRTLNRLNASLVAVAKGPASLSDGGHLSLAIDKNHNKRWVFLYARNGKPRELSLGPYPALSLSEARKKRDAMNASLAKGEPPQSARSLEQVTFRQVAAKVVARRSAAWRSEVSASHWRISVERHCKNLLDRPIASISLQDILATLKPLYDTAPNFASITRSRIEQIFAYARAYGLLAFDKPNPADHEILEHLLPTKPAAVHRVALAYEDVPALIAELAAIRSSDARMVAAAALQFTILAALRVGEACGSRWSEIDVEKRLLTVPASRMKSGVAHVVPLSGAALKILRSMEPMRGKGDVIFPASRRAGSIDSEQPLAILRTLRRTATVHGFRSSFRDWCGDRTPYPREIAEAALAHTIGGVEAAYRRGTALAKRAALMDEWARFCCGDQQQGNKIIAFPG